MSAGSIVPAGGGADGVADVAFGPCGTGVAAGDPPGFASGGCAGGCTGELPHAASIPTIRPLPTTPRRRFMGLILLEALGAMALLVLIVWWTMFSGRKNGEIEAPKKDDSEDKKGH